MNFGIPIIMGTHLHLCPITFRTQVSPKLQYPLQTGNVVPHGTGIITFAAAEPAEDDHLQLQKTLVTKCY